MKIARLMLLSTLALAGCGGADFSDLRAYMNEVQARPKGAIDPLPKVAQYESFTYQAGSLRSPFQPTVKVESVAALSGSKDIKPDETRVRQYLEGFALETFQMVGILRNEQSLFALLQGGNGVHRVRVGDYLGKNHGRIVRVDESHVEVVEIVPDGDGGWLERPASLVLKERS